MRYPTFKHRIQNALAKEPDRSPRGPRIRQNIRVLWIVIAICVALSVISMACGAYFSDPIVSFLNTKGFPPMDTKDTIWMSILIFLTIAGQFYWGIAIFTAAYLSSLRTCTVEGEITGSEIESYYDSDEGDVFFIVSTVTYSVKGHRYSTEGWHNFETTVEEDAKEKFQGLKRGTPVTVIYDPKNPYSMTLDSQEVKGRGEMLSGLGMIGFGLLLSVFLGSFF